MELTIDLNRETDGRWTAEVRELNDVIAKAGTMDDAITAVKALALRVVGDRAPRHLGFGPAAPAGG